MRSYTGSNYWWVFLWIGIPTITVLHKSLHKFCCASQKMAQQEPEKEMCKKLVSVSESDAVHPRFQTEDPQAVREFQKKYDYYCDYCNQFFAPTVEALKVHFKGDMVRHKPYGSCYYCKGDVYQYLLNNQRQLYHSCKEHHKEDQDS